MNTFNKTQSGLFFLFLVSIVSLCNSCSGDDETSENDPCSEIKFTGKTMEFNGDIYQINEYSYSDFIVLNHNFRFKAFNDSCTDSLEINLDFSHSVSAPQFSLAGEYTSKFTTNVLELELEEMSGTFQLGGVGRQYIVSGGSATISEPDNSSYMITVDASTSTLTGGNTSSMQLSVVVDK